jgi:general secretion pathway protein G
MAERRTAMGDEISMPAAFPGHGSSESGFTLLELMIVITIIMILATVGVGRYQQAVLQAHEAALRQDLSEMRKAIDNYTLDKKEPPSSLEDLHSAQYLREVPTDPITHQKDWTTETCEYLLSTDQQSSGGICNVRSASEAASIDGSNYNSW